MSIHYLFFALNGFGLGLSLNYQIYLIFVSVRLADFNEFNTLGDIAKCSKHYGEIKQKSPLTGIDANHNTFYQNERYNL